MIANKQISEQIKADRIKDAIAVLHEQHTAKLGTERAAHNYWRRWLGAARVHFSLLYTLGH